MKSTPVDQVLSYTLQAADVVRAVKIADARNLGGNRSAALELIGLLLCDALDALEAARGGAEA